MNFSIEVIKGDIVILKKISCASPYYIQVLGWLLYKKNKGR